MAKRVSPGTPTKDRLLHYRHINEETGCWEWTGSRHPEGYGNIITTTNGIQHRTRAPRLSYECFVGPIPEGLHVLHKCDNPCCFNPDHLWIGTHADNMADKARKKRVVAYGGEKNVNAKLTEQQVQEIRNKYVPRKYSFIKLAREYGVGHTAIYGIISGRTWKESYTLHAAVRLAAGEGKK